MGWVVNVTLRPLCPRKRDAVPILQERGGSQDRYGRVRKISSTSTFDPRTAQPAASRYTDWAIPAHIMLGHKKINAIISPSIYDQTRLFCLVLWPLFRNVHAKERHLGRENNQVVGSWPQWSGQTVHFISTTLTRQAQTPSIEAGCISEADADV
jgi:hypothetical protein